MLQCRVSVHKNTSAIPSPHGLPSIVQAAPLELAVMMARGIRFWLRLFLIFSFYTFVASLHLTESYRLFTVTSRMLIVTMTASETLHHALFVVLTHTHAFLSRYRTRQKWCIYTLKISHLPEFVAPVTYPSTGNTGICTIGPR